MVIRHVERQERESEAALSPEGWSSNSSRSWDDVIRRQFRQHSRLGQAVKALSRCSRWRRTLLSRLATISGDLEWCIAPSFPVICTLSCRVSPRLSSHGILISRASWNNCTCKRIFRLYSVDSETSAKYLLSCNNSSSSNFNRDLMNKSQPIF